MTTVENKILVVLSMFSKDLVSDEHILEAEQYITKSLQLNPDAQVVLDFSDVELASSRFTFGLFRSLKEKLGSNYLDRIRVRIGDSENRTTLEAVIRGAAKAVGPD